MPYFFAISVSKSCLCPASYGICTFASRSFVAWLPLLASQQNKLWQIIKRCWLLQGHERKWFCASIPPHAIALTGAAERRGAQRGQVQAFAYAFSVTRRSVHLRSTATWERRNTCTVLVNNQGKMEGRGAFWSDLRALLCLCSPVWIIVSFSPLKYTWLGQDKDESLNIWRFELSNFKLTTVCLSALLSQACGHQ